MLEARLEIIKEETKQMYDNL